MSRRRSRGGKFLQVGLYDPCDSSLEPIMLDEPRPPTRETRMMFASAIKQLNRNFRKDKDETLVAACFNVEPPRFQLGIYDPCDDTEPVDLIGRPSVLTDDVRQCFRQVIEEYNDWAADGHSPYCLAVFKVRRKRKR